ncbi:MAG: protein kinase [Planctomycetes bacterium]|nr:protein kinase [Planctomycetota bacterium]
MNEQEIFLAALDIPGRAERSAYLDQACGADGSLRQQVDSLLSAHARSGEFLDVPACVQLEECARPHETRSVRIEPHFEGPQVVATPSDPRNLLDTQAEPMDAECNDHFRKFLEPSANPKSLGRLGHYEVLEVVGQGGFGTVVKAFDEKLQRTVAIKIMAPALAATSPARKRFLREARSSAAIRHENVVDIHAIEEQPVPFLVMEYVAGETLQQRLDRVGPLDALETLRIGVQIAQGLAAAHAMGKIHRDIKPANILLETGVDRVKITDFGLARAADDASLTQSGYIAGTPMYMAPEQAQGGAVDHRADLFSFGSVLYVMCSGRPPFRASTTLAVLKRVAEDTPRPIREIIPEIPLWLSDIIAKLHAKKPEDRFQSAKEVADRMAHYLTELQLHGKVQPVELKVAPAPEPTLEPRPTTLASRPSRLCCALAIAAAVSLLLMLLGLSIAEATGVTTLSRTVIRLFSPEGTIIVEVDDPDVSVSIDGADLVITGVGTKEIRVKPGQYKILARKDGKIVRQELVTITKNGREVVRILREIPPLAKNDPEVEKASFSPKYALKFEAKDDAVSVPGVANVDLRKAVTLEAWVKFNVAPSFANRQMAIVGQSMFRNDLDLLAEPDDRFHFYVGTGVDVQSKTSIEKGKWYHIAATYVANDRIEIFVNGELEGTRPISQSLAANVNPLAIGSAGEVWPDRELRGLVAGVRISRSARYAKSFTPEARFKADSDTVALYHFDEGQGDELKDASSNGHHGKIAGAKWVKGDGTAADR